MFVFFSLVIAYLLGSISFSDIVTKAMKLPDPRTQGSGNAGATNVYRGNKKAGILVLIGDVLKGVIAVAIGYAFRLHGAAIGFVALAAVLGHIFPVFYKFKGGKGVATAAGTLLIVSFWTFIFVMITWAIVLFVTRYVSLASMVAAIAAPIYLLIGGNFAFFFPYAIIAVLIIWKHSNNIQRLREGVETRINF